ncbi:unnamed protein product [Camellia sinensis]
MDLETENRIAAILMKEAAELWRQAEEGGVHVYLRQPNVRGQPNSRFPHSNCSWCTTGLVL